MCAISSLIDQQADRTRGSGRGAQEALDAQAVQEGDQLVQKVRALQLLPLYMWPFMRLLGLISSGGRAGADPHGVMRRVHLRPVACMSNCSNAYAAGCSAGSCTCM